MTRMNVLNRIRNSFKYVSVDKSYECVNIDLINNDVYKNSIMPIIEHSYDYTVDYIGPEDEIRYAKLHMFYDKPIWKDGRWCCAREMCEVKNYMFPEVEIGQCVELKSIEK